MRPKSAIYESEARQKLYKGVEKLTKAVACTLGPGGRNVVYKRVAGFPMSTKDGVTVAKEFNLEDTQEDVGAMACKMAAMRANDLAGDGTTSSTVLTNSFLKAALDYVEAGANPHKLKEGMNAACDAIVEKMERMAKPVSVANEKQLKQIATISGNDPVVGNYVGEAFIAAGEDGIVILDEEIVNDTKVETTKGMSLDVSYETPWCINNIKNRSAEYSDAYVLVYGDMVNSSQDLYIFLEKFRETYGLNKPLLLVTTGLEGDALDFIAANRKQLQGEFPVVAIRAPLSSNIEREDTLKDIAAFCGAEYIPANFVTNISKITMGSLGSVKKVIVTTEKTELMLNDENKEKLDQYIEDLKEHEDTIERVARLRAKLAVLKIGATTWAEVQEIKFRYEDAINAVKSALKKGVLPGGGAGLVVAASKVSTNSKNEDFVKGFNLIKNEVFAPMRQILENSAVQVDSNLMETIASKNSRNFIWTIDGLTGEIVKAYKAGILDPVVVTESALKAAVSIAGTFATTDCVLTEIIDD